MQKSENNGFIQKQNKGFTVHLGETYIGHIVINEDRVNAHTLAEMQKPAVMAKILADAACELRKFIPKEERANRDTSSVDSIIASVGAEESDDGTDKQSAEG